jgi:hypothetical protein
VDDLMPLSDLASRPRLIRGAWGGVLLVDPGLPLRVGGGENSREVRAAVRVLGARHLVEATVLTRTRDPRVARGVRAVDAVHGLSMLILAAVSPRLRRDALLSAASAGALILLPGGSRSGAVT